MRSICVFCGASPGVQAAYGDMAVALGQQFARQGIRLVYGGGNVGLMGIIADAVLAAGGEAIGVIPEFLRAREVAHQTLSTLEVVDSMHTRKARMAELSDGFIAMPGGFGTLEEFCEVLTWGQLGLHRKPMGLLNVGGYYDPLLAMFDLGVQEGFVSPIHRSLVLHAPQPENLLTLMAQWQPPVTGIKWLDTPGET